VTADTAFHMASVSKVFVGAAIAMLIDQKVIASLDDDICDVLPTDFNLTACQNPYFPDQVVTWRMLATHRSSLIGDIPYVQDPVTGQNVTAAYGPSGGYDPDIPAAGNPTCPLTDVQGFYRDIMLDQESETSVGRTGDGFDDINWYNVAQDDLEGGVWNPEDPPGSYNDYSNFAVGYIAALVEYATGISLEDYCQSNVFQPLGMTRTSWFMESLPEGTVTAMPTYVTLDANNQPQWTDVGYYCYIDYASGQLHTTANDMAQWGDAMLQRGVPMLWTNETATSSVFGCQEQDETGMFLDETGNVTACQHALLWGMLDNDKKEYWFQDILESDDDFENWIAPFLDLDWTDAAEHAGGEFGIQTQLIVFPAAGVYAAAMASTSGNDEAAAQMLIKVLAEAAMDMIEKGENAGTGVEGSNQTAITNATMTMPGNLTGDLEEPAVSKSNP